MDTANMPPICPSGINKPAGPGPNHLTIRTEHPEFSYILVRKVNWLLKDVQRIRWRSRAGHHGASESENGDAREREHDDAREPIFYSSQTNFFSEMKNGVKSL